MSDIAPPHLAKAVHTWSLFRTLGEFVADGSMPSGSPSSKQTDTAVGGPGGRSLLQLVGDLADHGYSSIQLCHFYLPSTDAGYLRELSATLAQNRVRLECFLIDDGDLTGPDPHTADWLSDWCAVAEGLQAERVRLIAGKQPPTPDLLDVSAAQLRDLAGRHSGIRVVVENWHALLPDAASVIGLLDRTGPDVGFLIDTGNWTGPQLDADLAAVAGRAETCQAKCRTTDSGELELDRYRQSLTILRDHGYRGPLALVYDGPDTDEWGHLEQAHAVVTEVFGATAP